MTLDADDREASLDTITLEEVKASYGEDKATRLIQYGLLRGEHGSECWSMDEFETIYELDELESQEAERGDG
jgi:hypothetical protein